MSKFRDAIVSMAERGWTQNELVRLTEKRVNIPVPAPVTLDPQRASDLTITIEEIVTSQHGAACLQGHLGMAHGLITEAHTYLSSSGVFSLGSVMHVEDAVRITQTADEYVRDCKLLAGIIVEHFPERLTPIKLMSGGCHAGKALEEIAETEPHSVILCFNDHEDTTVDDCCVVLEKAAIADESDVKLTPQELAEALVIE